MALGPVDVESALARMKFDVWVKAKTALRRQSGEGQARALEIAREAFASADLPMRLLLAYLFPEEDDFFPEEDRRWGYETRDSDSEARWLYQVAVIRKTPLADRWIVESLEPSELVKAVGDAAVPALRMRILNAWGGPWCRSTAEALVEIETQEAANVLAEHAHTSHVGPIAFEALRKRPEQGIVALARHLERIAAARRKKTRQHLSKPRAARTLLTSLVRANRPVAEGLVKRLEGDARGFVAAALDETSPRPEAAASELPPVLADPPWRKKKSATKKKTKRKKAPRPALLAYDEKLDWGDVDPETLTNVDCDDPPTKEFDEKILARLNEEREKDGYSFLFQLQWLTDDAAKKVLLEWPADAWYGQQDDVEAPLARFGLEVLEPLVAFVKRRSDRIGGLAWVDSPRVAPLFAHCYANVKKTREQGETWLRARPRAAAIGLVPELFDAKGKERKAAEAGIRFLANESPEVLAEIAAAYGDDAQARVDALANADPSPLAQLKRVPKMPRFVDVGSLPRPILRSGKAMGDAAVGDLLTLLAVAPPGQRLKELDQVLEACDRASVASFAWGLFGEWLLAGASSKQKWAFFALSWFGDADAARELGPMIKAWAPGGFPSRAQLGIDVLRAMGTDAALLEIHKTAERVRSRALARHAKKTMEAIAKERGLSREELADRLVPDLDLDDDGSRTFDYGGRTFRVVFDEHLVASIVDQKGNARKDLPRPNAGDDETLAQEARAAFRTMKKEAKSIAKDRILRLERAMIEGRSWPRDTFMSFFALHPLLGHLARRLVWGVVADDPRRPDPTFRVAEDGTLADIDDEELELTDDAKVVVVHPATLSDATRRRWGDLLVDYELLQPFPQLERPLPTLSNEDAGSTSFDRWQDPIPSKKVLRLVRRGWRASSTEQGGVIAAYERELAGHRAVIALEPGIHAGDPDMEPEQRIGPLQIARGARLVALGDADPIVVGEVLSDLSAVIE
jgi:hypothetical protein